MKRRALQACLLAGLALGYGGLAFHPKRQVHSTVETRGAAPKLPTEIDVAAAINGLEMDRAERLLREYPMNAPESPALRARFALYRGDCDEARAVLSSTSASQSLSIRELSQLSEGCARAVAGAKIIADEAQGIWVRLQDDADAVWVPLIADVAARARDVTGAQLGVTLPRPLRIELVMDHASLSALTGLPLQAAETTGTVAVARWGRVTMLSPRSFDKGYPWQDTLAHEITHLLVTCATRDTAPLWLQEALAKRFETAWRSPRPLDGIPNQHWVTRTAWLQGQSVGIDKLGASIALLPSPESAKIAYAEVSDFLEYILHRSGWDALRLLLRDLRDLGAERTSSALASVTGTNQEDWILRWRLALSNEGQSNAPNGEKSDGLPSAEALDDSRRARLAELLASRHAWAAVEQTLSLINVSKSEQPELHTQAGLAKLQLGIPEKALESIGSAEALVGLQGDWLALRGRALSELGRKPEAERHFDMALAYAPTDERICCEGRLQSEVAAQDALALSIHPVRRPLCLAARSLAASAGHPPIE